MCEMYRIKAKPQQWVYMYSRRLTNVDYAIHIC